MITVDIHKILRPANPYLADAKKIAKEYDHRLPECWEAFEVRGMIPPCSAQRHFASTFDVLVKDTPQSMHVLLGMVADPEAILKAEALAGECVQKPIMRDHAGWEYLGELRTHGIMSYQKAMMGNRLTNDQVDTTDILSAEQRWHITSRRNNEELWKDALTLDWCACLFERLYPGVKNVFLPAIEIANLGYIAMGEDCINNNWHSRLIMPRIE